MVTQHTRVIRLHGPVRVVTALVAAGVALGAVPAASALVSPSNSSNSQSGAVSGAVRTNVADAVRVSRQAKAKHDKPLPKIPGWDSLSALFTPKECASPETTPPVGTCAAR